MNVVNEPNPGRFCGGVARTTRTSQGEFRLAVFARHMQPYWRGRPTAVAIVAATARGSIDMRSIISILACAGVTAFAALPAWATAVPIPVPEPTTLTLVAVGAAAAAAAYRLRGRR